MGDEVIIGQKRLVIDLNADGSLGINMIGEVHPYELFQVVGVLNRLAYRGLDNLDRLQMEQAALTKSVADGLMREKRTKRAD